MQPYFLPYIGYFQLITQVDTFVVYDQIKYTKKGWINRNRYLLNGKDQMFSLPLQRDSDMLNICDRQLAENFERSKLISKISEAYRKAPYYRETLALFERIVMCPENNLFGYVFNAIIETCSHLDIHTKIVKSSSVEGESVLQGKERVLALCHALGANAYLNPIGGLELYSKAEFSAAGVPLSFLKSRCCEYPQFGHPFVPWLSILDVLMFNSRERVGAMLRDEFDLV